MPVARPEPPDTRVIAHIDLDCFYVQVEQRRNPELNGKPTAVVQYKPFRGGAIIAVGYEARHVGVTRIMRGDDARKLCPDINLVQVPVAHGKADLTIYRDAGTEVVEVFSRMGICERASIDEVYLDITEAAVARLQQSAPYATDNFSEDVLGTHIVGLVKDPQGNNVAEWLSRSYASRSDQLLACGALIISELRTAVVKETQFTTSAGIAHNKMLAKLASGMHKPAQQTLIPSSEVQALLANLPTKKIKHLGGKLGKSLESELGIKTLGDLLPYTESKLQSMYGVNTGTWLWRVARGMNGEEVEGRVLPKSHGCSKTFPGPEALKNLDSIRYWLSELSAELQERLDEDLQLHHRKARLLVVHASCHIVGKASNSKPFPSKSCVLRYGKERVASDAVQLFKRSLSEFCPDMPKLCPAKGEAGGMSCVWAVTALSVGANNMYEVPAGKGTITRFFSSPAKSPKERASGTASTSLPSSPVSDVLYQAASTLHDRVGAEFQDEEVISLNEPDENILNLTDASSSHCNSPGIFEVEEVNVDSPLEDEEEEKSRNCESEAPASPNAYSVLSRRERSAWTQERESKSQVQSGICSPCRPKDTPLLYAESHSRSCKSAKRNLMDRIGPSACSYKDLVCTPKFGELGNCTEPLPAIELSDISSDCHQKDVVVDGSIGSNSVLESQKDLAGVSISKNKLEVILCSPLESGLQQNLVVGPVIETDHRPEFKSSMTDMQHTMSVRSNLAGGSINIPSTEDSKLMHPVLVQQVVPLGPVSKPLEHLTTSQVICKESPVYAPEECGVQLIRPRDISITNTVPHQNTSELRFRLASQRHPSVSSDQVSLSPNRAPAENVKSPTSDANSVPPNAQSSEGRNDTSVHRQGPASNKKTVFTRVDELWEKWKVASQSSTTPEKNLGNWSRGGLYEQHEIDDTVLSELPEDTQRELRGQSDRKRPKKRKKSVISDFFTKSPTK